MDNKKMYVIGLMSGTSLDGLDLVYVEFDKTNYSRFRILYSETKPYSKKWMQSLSEGIFKSKLALEKLDVDYGALLGDLVNDFIGKYKITNIDFIASHGHTILHQPEKGLTFQIGSGQVISDLTKRKVICDFRTQDVKLGGQGAPLVPIGDELLFYQYEVCLNLGGFANISFKEHHQRIAFDICPVNIVMNHYAQKLGFQYDDRGAIASLGKLNNVLLAELNNLEFYRSEYPKSLGLEWVQENIFPIIDATNLFVKDILRTFIEHIAIQLTKSLKNKSNVFVTGGGVYNQFLMGRLQLLCKSHVVIPNKQTIDFKEALIFAFLGLLKVENKINCLSSVTGAKYDHCSGKIFLPKKM